MSRSSSSKTLQQRFLKQLPERLIGDRAYDSDRRTVARYAATAVAGTSSASSPGCCASGSWSPATSGTPATFLGFAKLAYIVILLRQPTCRGIRRLGDSYPFNGLSDAF